MEPLSLSNRAKKRLLKMCEGVYPEYDFTLDKWKEPHVTYGLKTKKLYEHHIHWYEFCTLHLAVKLLPNLRDLSMFYLRVYSHKSGFGGLHPVDYLYSVFNKINKIA